MSLAQERVKAAVIAAALAACSLAAVGAAPAQTAAAIGGACGSVSIGQLNPTSKQDAWTAQTCFAKAFSTCDNASLLVSYGSVDTGVRRTFTTLRSDFDNSCQVVDIVEHYRVPNYSKSDTYLCAALSQTADGLVFTKCGDDGDVMVPFDPTSPKATAFNH
jgi:hypothetical protein